METSKDLALITGATSGIGLELARLFAKDNRSLLLVARPGERLEKTGEALRKLGTGTIATLGCDLGEANAAAKVYTYCQEKGLEPSQLVNNAGFGDLGLFTDCPLEKINGMMQLNMLALTELTHFFLPAMVKQKRGQILNVASTASFQPGPLMAVYYATKAYVLSFSEALRNELKDTGVTVTILCPGPTTSGFQKAANMENSRLVKGAWVMTSEKVAQVGYQAMKDGRGIIIPGLQNRILAASVRFTPRNVVTSLVRKMQERVSAN